MRALLTVAAALGMTGAPVETPRAQTAEATLDRAVAAYSKVKTLRASFTQTLTNPLTGSAVTSSCEMVQRVPGQLAVNFTDPAGDRIVADGRVVWLYLPSTNPGQVIKVRAGAGAAGVPDVTSQFLDAPRKRYTVTGAGRATVAGRGTQALTLMPRSDSLPFTKATIWVDDADGLVRQFETTDQSGVTRRVTITKLAVNPPVERTAFVFVPPKGVKVFDQTTPSR